ncbi:Plasmodium vivax Vir protein, putative [Plasmodium vivax]|uniref:Vir protein, putative n=1 Tax=Plasmodium vivax TaxID=5855 RepID=A0A1G4HDQ8_PLAVI|nr:Plasmodium vivax Vir protein, putative [Plasmodium vivax]
MVEEIEDIVEWIKNVCSYYLLLETILCYYFLNDVRKKYDNFDKSVKDDRNSYMYNSVCNPIMSKSSDYTDVHKNFCLKLVRNFGHFSNNHEFLNYNDEWCYDLNNWIYNSMVKHKIPKKIITECFGEYEYYMKGIGEKPRCIYYEYDNLYDDQMKIIKLIIFQSNMDIVKDMVTKESNIIDFHVQKYICDCVKIYEEMNRKHCPQSNEKSEKSNNTCGMLNTFKGMYKSFLSATQQENYNIPYLDDVENGYTKKCVSSRQKLPLTVPGVNDAYALPSLTVYRDEKKDENSPPSFIISEKPGGSISSTVSTAFGTVAGASSIVALLYKFTPGRNWMRSGIRGSGGRISKNLYSEQANELFYDGFEGEVMSSHNPTYNVGYGSV